MAAETRNLAGRVVARKWTLVGREDSSAFLVMGDDLEFDETVHVREVREGEITVTREELKRLWDQWDNEPQTDDTSVDYIIRKLWPEGQRDE